MTEHRAGASVDELLPGNQHDVDRLGSLVEAAGRLLGTLDLDAVLPEVLVLAQETLEADAYALWRPDPASGRWSIHASSGLSPQYVSDAPAALGANQPAVDEPLVISDISGARWLTEAHRAAHAAAGTRAMLVVPLRHRNETMGTLVFYSHRKRSFDETELRAATATASLAAAAIRTVDIYEAQTRLAEDRRLIVEAGELLASSLDYETTLANVANLVVPTLADWCIIDVLGRDGALERVALAHQDPTKVDRARGVLGTVPTGLDESRGIGAVIRTLRPDMVREFTEEFVDGRFGGQPQLAATVRELGLRSSITVPLVARGIALGAITLMTAESDRLYGEADLALAVDLARRSATAVDNALLYREAINNENQVRFLASAGSILNESLDYDTRLAALARLAVPRIADWCIVDVVEGAEIRRVAVAAADEAKQLALEELQADYPPSWDSPQPAARALREGGPVIFEDFSETPLEETVVDERHMRILQTLDPHSAIAVPLSIGGETLGAMTFAWAQTTRRYGEHDLPLIEDLAARAALAVNNARLYARERATSERLAFLAELSSMLASSLDVEQTLENLAELVVPRLGDWCAVDVLVEDGSIHRLAVVHRDPQKHEWAILSRDVHPPTADEREGSARVIRAGESIIYRRVSDDLLAATARSPEQLEVLRALGFKSAMVVPMKARGRTIGAITLVSSDAARLYDDEELEFAEHIARRAAAAVDNAFLYSRSEQRAQAARALAFIADGVLLVDEEGLVRIWNPAAEAITGLREADVVGRSVAEAVPGWETIEAHVPVGSSPGIPRAETVPIDLGHGDRWLSISGVSLPGGTVYAFRDLTDERRVERLKSEFVATISHELRTPLAAIYGAALTLRRDDPKLEGQRDGLLEIVAAESERLARIVNDILWVSRLESGTLHVAVESCDAAELATFVAAAAEAHLPENLLLSVVVDAGIPPVAADSDKLRQILANLLDNAVKYSPDGGTITFTVRSDDATVAFVIRDEGLGIPAQEHGRIFEKFYRLDPQLTRGVGGTGLGLYITRELARRMSGRVTVTSREGEGATFTVELPVAH
jgi:signal transduction histidine kinase